MIIQLYQNKLYIRLYCALLYIKQSLIDVLSGSWIFSKFNGHDFIICPILAHLPHFSCLSCHNLLLLGTRKPTTYLKIQEDHKVTIYYHFFNFGPVVPNVEISSKPLPKMIKFYQNFTDNIIFPKWFQWAQERYC